MIVFGALLDALTLFGLLLFIVVYIFAPSPPISFLQELKRSSKIHKVQDPESDNYVGGNSKRTIELYGKWQLEPLDLPHAVNGIVPKVNCF